MTAMFILLVALAAGFLLRGVRIPRYPMWLLTVVVGFLLFFFGLTVGGDPVVESEIGRIGLLALTLGCAGALGSAAAAGFFTWIINRFRNRR